MQDSDKGHQESATASPSSVKMASPALRRRLDSDLTTTTTYSDCSTDEESTRLLFSETTETPGSQSRRSSCGCLHCGRLTASEPASRRSSCGSTAFNRVMTNHRTFSKPKDVKFKRINKAKSRSLEELRGKLKYSRGSNTRSSSTNDDFDLDELEDDDDRLMLAQQQRNSGNRLTMLRAVLGQQQRSLSLDQESTTDASTN